MRAKLHGKTEKLAEGDDEEEDGGGGGDFGDEETKEKCPVKKSL